MSTPVSWGTSAVALRSRVPRMAGAAVERARLTVVPRHRPRTVGRVPFVALVSLVLLGGVVGLLLFNTSMQQASFAATALEAQARTMAAREQTLQMELEALRNPQAVAQAAKELGMVPPCQPAFLSLADGSVRGEPCVATAADDLRLLPKPAALPRVLNPPPLVIETTGSADTTAGDTGTRGAGGTDGTRETEQRQR